MNIHIEPMNNMLLYNWISSRLIPKKIEETAIGAISIKIAIKIVFIGQPKRYR